MGYYPVNLYGVVGIVTRLWAARLELGFDSCQGKDGFVFTAHPVLLRAPVGTGSLSPGLKCLGYDADHSPPPVLRLRKLASVPQFPYTFSNCCV
jgi:hypothetical protein